MEGERENNLASGDVVHNGIMVANAIEKGDIKKKYDMGYLVYVVQLTSIIGAAHHISSHKCPQSVYDIF